MKKLVLVFFICFKVISFGVCANTDLFEDYYYSNNIINIYTFNLEHVPELVYRFRLTNEMELAEVNTTSRKLVPTNPEKEEVLTGNPRVTDGDSIRFGKIRVRLFGIDAPETKQMCESGGKIWECGREAYEALVKIIGARLVRCKQKGVDRYRRVLAICSVGDVELNSYLVKNGWALSFKRYSNIYEREEAEARVYNRGLWKGEFVRPWNWRKKQRKGTVR